MKVTELKIGQRIYHIPDSSTAMETLYIREIRRDYDKYSIQLTPHQDLDSCYCPKVVSMTLSDEDVPKPYYTSFNEAQAKERENRLKAVENSIKRLEEELKRLDTNIQRWF